MLHTERATAPSAPSVAPDPPVYSVREFCRVHHICRSTLYELWAQGKGPASVMVGRRRYILGHAAQAWRQELEDDAARKKP